MRLPARTQAHTGRCDARHIKARQRPHLALTGAQSAPADYIVGRMHPLQKPARMQLIEGVARLTRRHCGAYHTPRVTGSTPERWSNWGFLPRVRYAQRAGSSPSDREGALYLRPLTMSAGHPRDRPHERIRILNLRRATDIGCPFSVRRGSLSVSYGDGVPEPTPLPPIRTQGCVEGLAHHRSLRQEWSRRSSTVPVASWASRFPATRMSATGRRAVLGNQETRRSATRGSTRFGAGPRALCRRRSR